MTIVTTAKIETSPGRRTEKVCATTRQRSSIASHSAARSASVASLRSALHCKESEVDVPLVTSILDHAPHRSEAIPKVI